MQRHFTFLVIFRVVILLLFLVAFAFVFGKPEMIVNHFVLSVIIIALVVELILFVNRSNRELAKLFNAIAHGDFTVSFPVRVRGGSFDVLDQSLNHIVAAFKEVTIEREAQKHLVQRLVNQINVGIIAVQNNESISLMNDTAENLLSVYRLQSWSVLGEKHPEFVKMIESIGTNGRKLVEWKSKDETRILSVDVSSGQLLEQPHRLIIIQDINNEIEQKEIEAWHKLIRILTHEIMNSVTPIASLSDTTQSMLQRKDGTTKTAAELNDEAISDIVFSLTTIQRRTEGLMRFVDHYRTLSHIPKPSFSEVHILEIAEAVVSLMQSELQKHGIRVTVHADVKLPGIKGDRSLIEQVFINLLSNSIYALSNRVDPQIKIEASVQENRNIIVTVEDNGRGIGEKELPHIFVPFFSTRQGGSGIGLSLSKQIMASHNGSIKAKSTLGVGTAFILRFPIA